MTTIVRRHAGLAALCLVALAAPAPSSSAGSPGGGTVSVIVRGQPLAGDKPAQVIRALGGRPGRRLQVIGGLVAEIPGDQVARLADAPSIHSVTPNHRIRLHSHGGYEAEDDEASMYRIAQKVIKADEMWEHGFTGRGIDVALIDSGVVPVKGLKTSGKVLHGPDLSFESQVDDLRHLDSFGHGTHMAGIIAGRDDGASVTGQRDDDDFLGVAPDARIVSLKVADASGATDVSQVIAAIDWVVQHRRSHGLNIRVLNLSFGTDGDQPYVVDPLAYAAEVAWRKGIVVVAAAGNAGRKAHGLANPAYDPYLIAVGGDNARGTHSVADDSVPSWSSTGDEVRDPDVVAPGKSVASLRAFGSWIDSAYPSARVGGRFFRGSGTSQAAAVVSGAVALIVDQRPGISPDEVKRLLTETATRLPDTKATAQGAGVIDLKAARDTPTPLHVQAWPTSSGTGSLELARGTMHVASGTEELRGEQDIFGAAWDGSRWSEASWAETSWSGGVWNGNRWSGTGWSGSRWSAATWTSNRWSNVAWSGNRWSSDGWSGDGWSGAIWAGNRWSTAAWGS